MGNMKVLTNEDVRSVLDEYKITDKQLDDIDNWTYMVVWKVEKLRDSGKMNKELEFMYDQISNTGAYIISTIAYNKAFSKINYKYEYIGCMTAIRECVFVMIATMEKLNIVM